MDQNLTPETEIMDPYLYIALELDYPTLKNLCAVSPKFATICNSNVLWAKKFKLDFSHLYQELFTDLNKLLDSNLVPSKDIYHLALLIDNQYNGESINYPLIIKNSTELSELRQFFEEGNYTRRIRKYIDRLLVYSSPDVIDKIMYYIDSNIPQEPSVSVATILKVLNDTYNKYITRISDKNKLIDFTDRVNSIIKSIDLPDRSRDREYSREYAIELIIEGLRHKI